MAKKNFNFMNLPIMPDGWDRRPDVVLLDATFTYYHEAGKTCTEHWGIAFLIAEGHHVAYRYLMHTSFGYGG